MTEPTKPRINRFYRCCKRSSIDSVAVSPTFSFGGDA
jgi:hypothetical protein